jgi:glucose/arabinose dehydrogenase
MHFLPHVLRNKLIAVVCTTLSLILLLAVVLADRQQVIAQGGQLGASISQKVSVPSSMRSSPFNVDRYLTIPEGFTISVYARVSNARFMAIAPNGDLLVSQPNSGKVLLVRPGSGGSDPVISDFASGLRRPHDIVFHSIGATTYVYIAETHQINRYIYNNGDTTAHDRQIVISGLPDNSTPELRGAYGHELKNIALDSNHNLYVSIASTCNACLSDTTSNPVRGAIYIYNADGTGGRLFARGLRNAEGLAFVPGTNDLWVVVNNRDNIAYPFDDGTGNYGRVVSWYVDNHPPEEFTRVRDGGNYGWPFCNPNPDTASGMDNMPFDRDYELNRNGQVDCATMDRINKGIQAHSAPLGLSFLQNTQFPAAYRNGVVTALHGSWNRTTPTGYKVIYFPWNSTTGTPGTQIDLVTGWLINGSSWGRPVDAVVDLQGNLFISDDASGTIYKLAPQQNAPTATPTTYVAPTFVPYTSTPQTGTPVIPPTATSTPTASPTPSFTPTLTYTASPTASSTLSPTNTIAPTQQTGSGTGLRGLYFDSIDFTSYVLGRVDTTVNFNWGSGSPHGSVAADTFSIRWTGYIEPRYSETYTFYTISDDGIRVWVNGQQIINNWTDHPRTENSGTISLQAGQKYTIKVEFYENGGLAEAQLLWSSLTEPKALVPQTALYPDVMVSQLTVNDTVNAGKWSIQPGLTTGLLAYGDRQPPQYSPGYSFSFIPAQLNGAMWIRAANSSKSYTGANLVSFVLSQSADVYVAWDDRTNPPGWLSASWTNTGLKLSVWEAGGSNAIRSFTLYKKRFDAGQVTLGAANTSTNNYITIIQ